MNRTFLKKESVDTPSQTISEQAVLLSEVNDI